jgi:hypothetical protein
MKEIAVARKLSLFLSTLLFLLCASGISARAATKVPFPYTPLSAYYDNSYVDEIKRSGFFAELWK